ncbi:hypothetical protein FLONG3_5054 [Fusarium longipes]|uniref:Heterokaryon incompatibility domain-containing protein n=1 Tax=Fusarium longipes TaxID=694270 RepID=A0A395SWG0_9HYPO|nr:hypothetical protein FLONG3_5054 [Fusarium longipes]
MSNVESSFNKQPYPGPPLPSPDCIRLIILQPGCGESIQCELVVRKLDSTGPYEALSYTWGDLSILQSISVVRSDSTDTHQFSVTSNCFSALRRLRYPDKPRVLWIDALAINQADSKERNQQVSFMSRIYSQADTVLIYLGETTEDSDLAMSFLKDCDDPQKETHALSYPRIKTLTDCLTNFFSRPWFTRVWVIQEALLSTYSLVYCGDITIQWSAIKNFYNFNVNMKWLPKLPFVVSTSKRFLTNTHMQVQSAMLKALLDSRHCRATDPRDKVYSILPLLQSFDDTLDICLDYDLSVAEVYTDCAIAIMAKRGLEVLYTVQGISRIPGLPSWVPDWSIPTKREIPGVDHMRSSKSIARQVPDTGHGTNAAVLQVNGQLWGRISRIETPFIAGHSRLPLDKWKDLLSDAAVTAIGGRSRCSMLCDGDSLFCAFYQTIGCVHCDMDDVETQWSQLEDPWNDVVRDCELKNSIFSSGGGYYLPFEDIPFHEAGLWSMPGSDAYAIRKILRTCHRRRFFITDTGYMGLAPEETEVGENKSQYNTSCFKLPTIIMANDAPKPTVEADPSPPGNNPGHQNVKTSSKPKRSAKSGGRNRPKGKDTPISSNPPSNAPNPRSENNGSKSTPGFSEGNTVLQNYGLSVSGRKERILSAVKTDKYFHMVEQSWQALLQTKPSIAERFSYAEFRHCSALQLYHRIESVKFDALGIKPSAPTRIPLPRTTRAFQPIWSVLANIGIVDDDDLRVTYIPDGHLPSTPDADDNTDLENLVACTLYDWNASWKAVQTARKKRNPNCTHEASIYYIYLNKAP